MAPSITPVIVDTIDLPGNEAHDVQISPDGNWAYSLSTGSRVYVIDIADPTNTSLVGNLLDNPALNTASGCWLDGDYLYVACAGGDALGVIDISTPASPTRVGLVTDITDLNGATDVVVKGNYAYVTAKDTPKITTVDISTPTAPTIVHTLTHASLTNPIGIAINDAETHLYVANNGAGAAAGIFVISIAVPAAPVVSSFAVNNGNGPSYVDVQGNYAYTITGGAADRMDVYDITSPAAASHVASVVDANMDRPLGITVRDDLACIPCQTDDGVVAFCDITDPTTPLYLTKIAQAVPADGTGPLYHAFHAEMPGDGYAYVSCGAGAFTTIDLGIPSSTIPKLVKLDGVLTLLP